MPSQKQLIILTLRDLARQCVKEQIHLKMTTATRRSLEADEAETRARLRHIKAKVNRELLANAKILGVQVVDDNDGEGEGWKSAS